MSLVTDMEVDGRVRGLYQIHERLGRGAYGVVWRATDMYTGKVVALKKIYDAFRNATDAQRTFREIMYLQEFVGHPSIVTLLNVIKASNNQDIYLVFDHMDTDLKRAVEGDILCDVQQRFVLYQLLEGLAYMHSADVIHRDLKPDNVLLNEASEAKLADFGLARSVTHGNDDLEEGTMTEYVATRWYRAPEILLGSALYTKAIDVWSLGCMFGHMLRGAPLFAGSSSLHQVDLIMQTLGRPSHSDVEALRSPYARAMVSRTNTRPGPTLRRLVPKAPKDALDLLERMLTFNPEKRITMEEALRHPYVAEFAGSLPRMRMSKPIHLIVDDERRRSVEDYRTSLYDAISRRRDEIIATMREGRGADTKSRNPAAMPPAATTPSNSSLGASSPQSQHASYRPHQSQPLQHNATGNGIGNGNGRSGDHGSARAVHANGSPARGSARASTSAPAPAWAAASARLGGGGVASKPSNGNARVDSQSHRVARKAPTAAAAAPVQPSATTARGSAAAHTAALPQSTAAMTQATAALGVRRQGRPASATGDQRLARGSGLGHSLRNASNIFGNEVDVLGTDSLAGHGAGKAGGRQRFPRASGEWRQHVAPEGYGRAAVSEPLSHPTISAVPAAAGPAARSRPASGARPLPRPLAAAPWGGTNW